MTLVRSLALQNDLVLAPGNGFGPAETTAAFMRFNLTQMPKRAFEVLAQALSMPPIQHEARGTGNPPESCPDPFVTR